MKRRRQGWPPQSHRYAADRRAAEIERAVASARPANIGTDDQPKTKPDNEPETK